MPPTTPTTPTSTPKTFDARTFAIQARAKGYSNQAIYDYLKAKNALPTGVKPQVTITSTPPPQPNYLSRVGSEYAEAGKNIVSDINRPAESASHGASGLEVAKQVGEAGLRTVGNISGAAFAPITEAVAPALKPVIQKIASLPGVAGGVKAAVDWANKHPEAAKDLGAVFNISLLGGGSAVEEPVTSAVGQGLEQGAKVAKGAVEGVSGVAEDVGKVAKGAKQFISPTEDVNTTVGKVLQGETRDIAPGKSGLSLLETKGVKTYKDLSKLAQDKIGKLSKQQDELLGKDTIPKKVQTLATEIKSGDKVIRHNYVLDSLEQLQNYYTKTNDIAKLAKVNQYLTKLDPVKGQGLLLKEVNDIARLHGMDLNAYNANGELASGLTKQAAENTRAGLKTTVRNLLPDDASKAIDRQISDIYKVRDLSKDMVEKVNTLAQRLQKPNILQKIGGFMGRIGRTTGIGDFASKLLGIEKVPGASTLNAVELEAKLAKNLRKINVALGKDDAGFIKDITEMAKDHFSSNQ